MAMDPSRAESVGPALLEHLAVRLDAAGLSYVETPHQIGAGYDTHTYAFLLQGELLDRSWARPLVIRIFPGADDGPRLEREAAVHGFVVERGYPAPRLLAVESRPDVIGRPFIVMERVSGAPVSTRLARGDLLAVYRLAKAVADAHVALHMLPIESFPGPAEGSSVDRQLARFREWAGRIEGLDGPLRWLEEHRDTVKPEEPCVCHNDFQPLNIIAGPNDRVSVIDWSNAEVGDRHQDIADLLVSVSTGTPGPAAPRPLLTQLRRRWANSLFAWQYVRTYRRGLPIDRDRLRYWEALRALGRWGMLMVLRTLGPESLAMKPGPIETGVAAQDPARLYRYFWKRTRA